MRSKITILTILALSLVTSCGKDKDDDKKSSGNRASENRPQNEAVVADGSNIKGIYAADIVPVNNNQHLLKLGVAAIQRDGDVFTARVKLKYGQRMTTLVQGIYTGTRCPTPKDDKNKDAYIDIKESIPAIGQMVIPLDGNLDSQLDGVGGFPTGDNILGAIMYSATASFERMFADLKTPDIIPDDNITKIKADEGLALEGRLIILQGINERVFLPPTAASLGERSPYKTIPVACGILRKVKKLPSELNTAI